METFFGALFGAIFAFMVNLATQYFKDRNRVRFYLKKIEHVLTAHLRLIQQKSEKFNEYEKKFGVNASNDLKRNDKTKIAESWFELQRSTIPFNLPKIEIDEIYPLLEGYQKNLKKILTADLCIQTYFKRAQ